MNSCYLSTIKTISTTSYVVTVLVALLVVATPSVDARPKIIATDTVTLTCRTTCDGLYKLCDENARHSERIQQTGQFGEHLLCIKVKADCVAHCLSKKGMFKPAAAGTEKHSGYVNIKIKW